MSSRSFDWTNKLTSRSLKTFVEKRREERMQLIHFIRSIIVGGENKSSWNVCKFENVDDFSWLTKRKKTVSSRHFLCSLIFSFSMAKSMSNAHQVDNQRSNRRSKTVLQLITWSNSETERSEKNFSSFVFLRFSVQFVWKFSANRCNCRVNTVSVNRAWNKSRPIVGVDVSEDVFVSNSQMNFVRFSRSMKVPFVAGVIAFRRPDFRCSKWTERLFISWRIISKPTTFVRCFKRNALCVN